MKKLLFLLIFVFIVGIFYGYQQNQTKIVKEKTKVVYTKTKSASVSVENGVTLIKNVPLIAQMPELQRGCEVTSLAMLLQFTGVDVGKMELAEKIKKLDTPYRKENGIYYYGNPNDGFVGDIYTFDKMGYGVYHEPVADLAEKYIPGQIVDISGSEFKAVLKKVSAGKPVWIITNSTFKTLPESEFRTWNTPSGQVQITWNEHSVVVTGFDKNHVYINDPLSSEKNRKMPLQDFKAAWEQMGSQAISLK